MNEEMDEMNDLVVELKVLRDLYKQKKHLHLHEHQSPEIKRIHY